MSYLLLTLNIDGVLCDNARSSHSAAARRWSCDYMEATHRYFPKSFHPCFNKIPYLCDLRYDRILYVDADCLIRSDAPNPFNLVPVKHIGVVQDCQPHMDYQMRKDVYHGVHECFYRDVEFVYQPTGKYLRDRDYMVSPFNGGVIMTTPKFHAEIFQELATLIQGQDYSGNCEIPNGHFEQALLNYAVKFHIKPQCLHHTWNHISPPVEDPVMHSFIYHFTGAGFGSKRDLLTTYHWKI